MKKGAFVLVFFAGILVLLSGCGLKRSLSLPQKTIPLHVVGLSGQWKDGAAFLTGKITGGKGGDGSLYAVTGGRVLYAWYPLENPPCEGCPMDYTGYEEVGEEAVTEGAFRAHLQVRRRRGILYFVVRLTGPDNAVGPVSERAKLVSE